MPSLLIAASLAEAAACALARGWRQIGPAQFVTGDGEHVGCIHTPGQINYVDRGTRLYIGTGLDDGDDQAMELLLTAIETLELIPLTLDGHPLPCFATGEA